MMVTRDRGDGDGVSTPTTVRPRTGTRGRPRGKTTASLAFIDACKRILESIQPASVRAVAYRLFIAKLLRNMSKNSTNKVSRQLTDARELGLVPWAWIVDESRELEREPTWADISAYLKTVERSYRRNYWVWQRLRLEVWSEKSTVRGMLAPVLHQYGVDFRSVHGYSSATAVKDTADESQEDSCPLVILYVGDWDPSGMQMSEEDLPGRLERYGGIRFTVKRIALTEADLPGLPTFPAEEKKTDPRYRWYIGRYGTQCWELDALSPVALRERLEEAIASYIDWDVWERCRLAEAAETDTIKTVVGQMIIARQASK